MDNLRDSGFVIIRYGELIEMDILLNNKFEFHSFRQSVTGGIQKYSKREEASNREGAERAIASEQSHWSVTSGAPSLFDNSEKEILNELNKTLGIKKSYDELMQNIYYFNKDSHYKSGFKSAGKIMFGFDK